MADVYGVVPADIAAELPGLFRDGFTPATRPTDAQVKTWITRADTRVALIARQLGEIDPELANTLPDMAKDYIIAFVKARVQQAVYAGNDPAVLAPILQSSYGIAKDALQAIRDLQTVEREIVSRPLPASVGVKNKHTW